MKIAIVTDDLTSATDGAAGFAERGWSAQVVRGTDQGLIPIKLMGAQHGVNVTIGLPFVRTSPDHGTAFDIAGRGLADASSLQLALETARDMSQAAAKG